MEHDLTEAKVWMRNALSFNRESYDYYGEINHTKLVEDCASELNIYSNDDYDIPEELFDLAIDISEQVV